MTALSANTPRTNALGGNPMPEYVPAVGVAASTRLYAGSAVGVNNSGYLAPMGSALGLRALGVSEEEVNNSSGAAGDLSANKIRRGSWWVSNNSSTEALTDADVGRICYALDDNTATRTNGGGTRSALGRVLDVDSTRGVLVEIGVTDDPDATNDLMLLANADLSAKQYHFVDIVNSSGTPKVASVSSAGGRIAGVLQNAPASGAMAIVRPVASGRMTRLIAGGSITCADSLASKNDGRAKTAVSARTDTSDTGASNDPLVGSFVGGIGLTTTTSDGDTMYALLSASGAIPQTAS